MPSSWTPALRKVNSEQCLSELVKVVDVTPMKMHEFIVGGFLNLTAVSGYSSRLYTVLEVTPIQIRRALIKIEINAKKKRREDGAL